MGPYIRQPTFQCHRHQFGLPVDVHRGKPEHPETLGFQPALTVGVAVNGGEVVGPVQLDHQPLREAGEVDDVGAYRYLAPELQAGGAASSQLLPDHVLHARHFLPQAPGSVDGSLLHGANGGLGSGYLSMEGVKEE